MQDGFARKYAIMEELDGGFSAGSTPEAFVRLDSWEGRIQVSLHVKGLKQGPFKYMLYLIFAMKDSIIPVRIGDVKTSFNGMQGGLEIDAVTLKRNNVRPEEVRFAAITAESQNKKWVPLFASFEKGYKWDESIRQAILINTSDESKDKPKDEPPIDFSSKYTASMTSGQTLAKSETAQTSLESKADDVMVSPDDTANTSRVTDEGDNSFEGPDTRAYRSRGNKSKRNSESRVSQSQSNFTKLESMLSNNFETYQPFKRANKGYSWYRVSDIAKLSNIMYLSGINVPLFANPKILVGLFKYKHILAGIYKSDKDEGYYVIGVPAKNEKDNKPFENACRWAQVEDSEVRDMTGYWLVYVGISSGEIVV